ncbi:MAG: hypothetical protein CVT59_05530 [Actinobacteria bacterium HGW-Actinobacteria-1]|nr:MAG: hypothetical protein CVT59_05530 [Actinobacteria bacterium HGW-Actinobacteria-1]
MDHRSYFAAGGRYPHLSGEYEVVAIDGDWLVCRLEDGREIRVTTQNAFRALQQLGVIGADSKEPESRLSHACEGRPCGPACIKAAVEDPR